MKKSLGVALTNASDDAIKTIMSRVKAIYSAKQSSSRWRAGMKFHEAFARIAVG